MENRTRGAAGGDGLLRRSRLVLLTAFLGLSACVSDALPRDDDDDDAAPRRDASADARDGDAGDARADAPRTDAQDTTVSADSDSAADITDAGAERPVVDAPADLSVSDVVDAADVGGPDVTMDPGVTDVAPDQATGDADAGADAQDATTIDVSDSGPSADGSDSEGSVDAYDAGGANDANDASSGSDTNDAATPLDAADDARDSAADTADGGVVVFYREDFNSDIGMFTRDGTVCGLAPPVWSNVSGFAHASEPIGTGASRIIGPTITVPTNVSNVRLRMSHRYNTEPGYDAAQLFVAVNGLAVMHVTTFTTGGYANGGVTNPNSCTLGTTAGQFPGWSGNQTEFVSEVNLAAAPFNVGADDTVSIVFRMTVDPLMSGAGWDINWVTLSGTSP
jgi:hypothetical protein